ncbi:MAG: hypothetical protein ABIT96_13355 [Ferruginibacter sp.]
MHFQIKIIFFLVLTCALASPQSLKAQHRQYLHKNWTFTQRDKNNLLPAKVPGCVYTDLLAAQQIPPPFFGTNETALLWIDSADWQYTCEFSADSLQVFNHQDLVFDGLDTWADVYLNDSLVLQARNMFRQYNVPAKNLLKDKRNRMRIDFFSPRKTADSLAGMLPFKYPDNNRVFIRKAAFQFGWDWGPSFAGCGIWKPVYIDGYNLIAPLNMEQAKRDSIYSTLQNLPRLIREKDSIGESFYFQVNGKPVFMKGANYIPLNIFLPEVKAADYRTIIHLAKEANMNMLRVWGGGIYEDDLFYSLCDSAGIYLWQDFMFAGAMYPADEAFLKNVKVEVYEQVMRLRHHKSIILWCGNNEIDEAWHQWGWQQQFNLHGHDSAKVWQQYKLLFEDSLRQWVHDLDPQRAYVPTSPQFGWGNEKSYRMGDSHYWGLWWGLEPWEILKEKTGRFVSEYGMQAMPGEKVVNSYTLPNDRHLFSPVLLSHQKAGQGFEKINYYLHHYFIDSTCLAGMELPDYIYLTNCLQYYILKNSIAQHLLQSPRNMGSLLWQLNDCWPATSWSITDFSRSPKAGWYAVKKAFSPEWIPANDTEYPKNRLLKNPHLRYKIKRKKLVMHGREDAEYVFVNIKGSAEPLQDNYFSLKKGEKFIMALPPNLKKNQISITSLYDVLSKYSTRHTAD